LFVYAVKFSSADWLVFLDQQVTPCLKVFDLEIIKEVLDIMMVVRFNERYFLVCNGFGFGLAL